MTTTDSRRFVLISALGVILFFLYQAWVKDHPAASQTLTTPATAPAAVAEEDDLPRAAEAKPAAESAATSSSALAPVVRVETDLIVAELTTQGADLRRLQLKQYPVSKDKPDEPLSLLDDVEGRRFVLQSGIAGSERPLFTHATAYSAPKAAYRLADGQDDLEVVLEARGDHGLSAQKRYHFRRGSYQIELTQTLRNTGAQPLEASPYVRLQRTLYPAGDEPRFTQTFRGVGLYAQKEAGGAHRFRKEAFDKLADDPIEIRQTGGWISFMQHYFLAAIIPPGDEEHTLSARPARNGAYVGQYVGKTAQLAAGETRAFPTRLYVGPKLQNVVGAVAPGLELTVDYGILTAIAEPLFWLMDRLHRWTANWGVAIILLTLVVKAALYKLSEAQYRSMAKMKKYGPRIQEIKERFGDDRERLQRAMMDLYKKEGFNPLAGCWPILLQFPIFIALYWVLLESVELRQADFVFWLKDLSAPDPYFVLPVLFGASMWAQQRLSGQSMTMDPMQQKVMNAMPVMLTAFFAFFQSGLVLYWLVSNLIGIAQQWVITRKLDREAAASAR